MKRTPALAENGSWAGPLRRRWSRLDDDAVAFAIQIVESRGVLEQLEIWREEDRERLGRHAGGAPPGFSERALMAAMVLTALDGAPMHAKTFLDILWRRISPQMRAELGVQEPPDERDELPWKALYRNVRTRFHGLLAPIDPSPFPKNRCVDAETYNTLVEERRARLQLTDAVLDQRADRLGWVINTLLEASLSMMPRWMRRQWNGSAALDATNVPAFAQPDRRVKGTVPRHRRHTPQASQAAPQNPSAPRLVTNITQRSGAPPG